MKSGTGESGSDDGDGDREGLSAVLAYAPKAMLMTWKDRLPTMQLT